MRLCLLRLPPSALLAGLAAVAAPGAAFASCTSNVPGEHVFALAGDNCLAQYGTYNPVATGATILPFNDPGFGFVADGGGSDDDRTGTGRSPSTRQTRAGRTRC